jgi:hypothetical protein
VSEIWRCDRPSFATMTKGSQLLVILSTMLASKSNEPKSIEMVFKTSPYILALLDRSPWPTALRTVLPYQALLGSIRTILVSDALDRQPGQPLFPRTFQSMSLALLFVGDDYHCPFPNQSQDSRLLPRVRSHHRTTIYSEFAVRSAKWWWAAVEMIFRACWRSG